MNTENKDPKASTEVTAPRAASSMISFNEFDDFLSRQWPRLLNIGWNLTPIGAEKEIPKVDILDYADRIEVRAALLGISKDALEISINNQAITIRATTKEEKKEHLSSHWNHM